MPYSFFKDAKPKILAESKILIIEDDRVQRMMLRQMFENLGFRHIFEAENGLKGWEMTQQVDPDLVLLDIHMPVMDGFAYCKIARENPDYNNTTILAQTGLTDLQNKAKIFEAGATDYVTKPIDLREITLRSFVHLERAMHLKELSTFNERVKRELSAAKQVIELTLPNPKQIVSLKEQYAIDLASEFKSSYEMGGDLWSFEKLDAHRLAVYCFDFSGHGIDSALNAMRIHSIISTKENKPADPGEFLKWLNNMLVALLPSGSFATMFYGIINTQNDTLTFASASTPSPVILYKNAFPATKLDGKGFPLGILKDASFETKSAPFASGDTLILYSDALMEVEMGEIEVLGEDRLIEMFKVFTEQTPYSSQAALDLFMKQFYAAHGNDLKDDLTFNVYHRI